MDITMKTNHEKKLEEIDKILDREWLKSTFLISDNDLGNLDNEYKWIRKNRYVSSADYKFTSSRPGMNMGVNPKPQFTRYADIRSKGKLKKERDNVRILYKSASLGPYGLGMGRYYSEAIDDNQQRIFLRFGVPKFSFLSLWVADAFDVKRAIMMNRGTLSKIFLEAVDITSMLFRIAYFPLMSLGAFIAGALVTDSRFYNVKPTMYLYWATVEDLLNSFISRRTMLPHIFESWTHKIDNKVNQEQTISKEFVDNLNKLLPDIIDSKGRISVFALALKAQSVFNRIYFEDYKKNEETSLSTDFSNYPLEKETNVHDTYFSNKNGEPSTFTKYIFAKAANVFIDSYDSVVEKEELPDGKMKMKSTVNVDEFLIDDDTGSPLDVSDAFGPDVENPQELIEQRKIENFEKKRDLWSKYKEYMLAELSEGAAFAVFNVDYSGSISESFSNSFTSNPIATMFNSISAKARNITDLASTVTNIPIIGDVIKTAADAGAIVVNNASFGLANPVLALLYGVNVEMPKVWESSSASLPRANYKIKLISPYGNPYSQLFNIYLPLAMILAGSLPRSTGSASHTSPFVCQLYDRGRVNISLGMIDSVNITRGTSNLAFSRAGYPNAIDVDISIANMDEIISVDLASEGLIMNDIKKISNLMKTTPMTDYINTITAMDVYGQIYMMPKIRLAVSETALRLNKYIEPDPAAFAAFTADKIPGFGILKEIVGNNVQSVNDLTRGF